MNDIFTQESSLVFLEATPKQLSYQNQSFILYYKTVNSWVSSYSTSSDDGTTWFSINEEYGLDLNSIEINVSYNPTEKKRVGRIHLHVDDFFGNSTIYTFVIEQAVGKPLFKINDDVVYMPNSQSSKGIDIIFGSSSNIRPIVTSDEDWLSGDIEYLGINSTLNVNCTPNVFAQRTAHLTVSYVEEQEDWQIPSVSYSKVITVTQEGSAEPPHITFSSDVVGLDAEGMVSQYIMYESFGGAKVRDIRLEGDFFRATLATNQISVSPKSPNVNQDALRGMIYVNITDSSSRHLTTYGILVVQDSLNVDITPTVLNYTSKGIVAEGSNDAVRINRNGYDIESVTITEGVDWVVTRYDTTSKAIFIDRVQNNDSIDTREGIIKLNINVDVLGNTVTLLRQFKVIQEGREPITEEPIWKDTVFSLDKNRYGDYKYYRLVNQDTNEEIYRGHLFFINDTIDINIADIAKDYINFNKYPFDNALTNNNGYVNISFELSSDNNVFEFMNEYHLFNNYEYDYLGFKWGHITDPIQDYCDIRQFFIYSVQDFFEDGGNTNVILELRNPTSTIQQNSFKVSNGQYTMASRLYGSTSVSVSTTYTKQFDVINTCCDYCLYYMNRMGGWSWILINGETLKNNKITTNSYHKNVSNLKSSNFQKYNYLKQISESWKLNTEYLTDEQSRKMEDLLTSNLVYLHDLNEDRLIAVTIDESSVDLKTFSNQKKKPYLYSFTVTNSQQKVRR